MKAYKDRYVVVGPPQQGGMSEVYPAIDSKSGGRTLGVGQQGIEFVEIRAT
jgi:hypothetical protein